MRINIYVTEEQHEWVKDKPKGFIGDLISREMAGEELVEVTTDKGTASERTRIVKKVKKDTRIVTDEIQKQLNDVLPHGGGIGDGVNITGKAGDGMNTCKKCGSLLPFYKGKCKQCGGK